MQGKFQVSGAVLPPYLEWLNWGGTAAGRGAAERNAWDAAVPGGWLEPGATVIM